MGLSLPLGAAFLSPGYQMFVSSQLLHAPRGPLGLHAVALLALNSPRSQMPIAEPGGSCILKLTDSHPNDSPNAPNVPQHGRSELDVN